MFPHYYNNLGCLHQIMRKPNLAIYYFKNALDRLEGGENFSLAAAPVLFTLAGRPDLLAAVQRHQTDLCMLDYRVLAEAVAAGPGLERTQQLCSEYVETSLLSLAQFGENEAAEAIRKITLSMLEE